MTVTNKLGNYRNYVCDIVDMAAILKTTLILLAEVRIPQEEGIEETDDMYFLHDRRIAIQEKATDLHIYSISSGNKRFYGEQN